MKKLIKKILPKDILQAALDIRDRKRLSEIETCSFDQALLKLEFDSKTLFSNPNIYNFWLDANVKINKVFSGNHISGGINPGDRRALYYLITALKPGKVLEVGTHIGISTLYIAQALKNIGPQAAITTVDILDVNDPQKGAWKKLKMPYSPVSCAEKLGCRDHITFKTMSALSFMMNSKEKFDFIFLDGDHSASAVYREVSAALSLLNPNGVILLHDYYPGKQSLFPDGNIIAGPFRALDRIQGENPMIKVQPLGALPWETKQGSCMTSLALLTRR